MYNLPDDWGAYYRNCDHCGARYHASEGGCGDCVPCEACDQMFEEDERSPYNHELCAACDVVECSECGRDIESGTEDEGGMCPSCVGRTTDEEETA